MALIIKEGTDQNKVLEGTEKQVMDAILAELAKANPSGFVIRTQDQERLHLSTQLQEAENKAYLKSRKELDDIIMELTGIPKATDGHEKTTDYLKRATAEKLKEVTDLKTQLEDVKNKGANGNALAAEFKQKSEQLQKLVEQVNKEKAELIDKYEADIFNSKVNLEINEALSEFRPLMATVHEPNILNDVIEARVNRFKRENKPGFSKADNMVTWADPANAATRLNRDDAKPSPTKTLLRGYFEDLFDKGKTQPGTGSGGNGNNGKPGAEGTPAWKSIKLPTEIKSKVTLYDYLKKDHKMDDQTKEFNEAYEALGKDLPLREN